MARGDRRPGVALKIARRGVLHARAQHRVDDEGAELRGEFAVVLGEEAVAAVLDQFGGAAGAHGHDRQPRRARFERDDAEGFVQRGQREEIGGGELRGNGVARNGAEELDVIGDAEPRGFGAHGAGERTVAGDDEPHLSIEAVRLRAAEDLGERAHEREWPFARVQAQDRRDVVIVARGRRGAAPKAEAKRVASMPLGKSATSPRPLMRPSSPAARLPTAERRVGHAAQSGTNARSSSAEARSTSECDVKSDGTPMSRAR